jgi:AcrR family transcriptional regulator
MMTPRSDVSKERRAQIIEAALNRFMRQGYNNTTMDDIVAESGLSKGTLYWYFDSKDDLFNAAMMSVLEDIGQEALENVSGCSTAADKLRATARAAVGVTRQAKGLFNLFLEFWASSSRREEASQLWLDLLEEYKDFTAAIIEEGIEDGEFAPVEADHLVWAVLAAYDGLTAYITLKPDLDLEKINTAFVDTLLEGLLADAQRE